MASILEQYGIKEVADVTIYKVDGDVETPFLHLDSLKVSTIEQTAEQSDAKGGRGNGSLIVWDYGKEINLTITDALYSPKSMSMMFGQDGKYEQLYSVSKYFWVQPEATGTDIYGALPTMITTQGGNWSHNVSAPVYDKEFQLVGGRYLASSLYYCNYWNINSGVHVPDMQKITITANDYPGTYKLVGDTLVRRRSDGKNEHFQFIIPRAKMSAEQTITLEAEGDPSVFNFNMRVLRPENGEMMQLIQYTI